MAKIRNNHLIEQLEGWRIDADFGLRDTGFASAYAALCMLMHMLDGRPVVDQQAERPCQSGSLSRSRLRSTMS